MNDYTNNSEKSEKPRLSPDVRTDSGAAALGNYTESSSLPLHANSPETLIQWFFRRQKTELQNFIRMMALDDTDDLGRVMSIEEYNEHPYSRFLKCTRTRSAIHQRLHMNKEYQRASISGVVYCGNSKVCPTCAAKIAVKRRNEIEEGIRYMESIGYRPVFCTFTHPHYRNQDCKEVLEINSQLLGRFRSGSGWKSISEKIDYQGLIRSREVTFGANGNHIHTHETHFVRADITDEEIFELYQPRWEMLCDKKGLIKKGKLKAFRKHALDVGFSTPEYLAKIDSDVYTSKLASEISLSSIKSGKDDSLHPFQMARLAFEQSDRHARKIFFDYCEAFKGSALIFWSHGLKKRCGIAGLKDEDVAKLVEPEDEFLLEFEFHAWNIILREKAIDYVKELAEKDGEQAVLDWLYSHGLDVPINSFYQESSQKFLMG